MSLHHRLRTETRDAHDRIEAAFDLAGSLASRPAYLALLRRLLAFHEAFEAAAGPHLAGTPIGDGLGRGALLRRDLAALGAEPDADVAPHAYPGRPEALGAAYVVEGSMLGGVLIAREVERHLGLGPETGNAFFADHGRDTARTWKQFCTELDSLADPATDDRVIAAAERTYAALEASLTVRLPAEAHLPAQAHVAAEA